MAEIEKQFTRLEAGVASLKRVQAALKRYHASVLKAACEGRLVPTEAELARRESRSYETGGELLLRCLATHLGSSLRQAKASHSTGADSLPLARLPEGWACCPMQVLAEIVDPQPSHRTPPEVSDGIPYIGIGDVRSDGKLDLVNARKVSPKVFEEHQGRYRLQEGDFIVGKIGTVGKAARLPQPFDYTLSANVVLIQPRNSSTYRGYLQIFLESPESQKGFVNGSRATTQAAFGIQKFRQLPVALPPLAEQYRIVAEVERRLSVIEEIETVVAANLKRTTRLHQSVLRRAFSDTCDEQHQSIIK